MTTETAANWGQLIEGIVALITIGGSMIAIFFNLKSKIDRLTEKMNDMPCERQEEKLHKIEIIQADHGAKINEVLPQINALINKLDDSVNVTNELVTQVALSNQSLMHWGKQIDVTSLKIDKIEERLIKLEVGR